MERRQNNWAHYSITWWDQFVLLFLPWIEVKRPSGDKARIKQTRRWTYYE
jgi:hypothetical protein